MDYSDKKLSGWCSECQMPQIAEGDDLVCQDCGQPLTPPSRMTQSQRNAAKFMQWSWEVMDKGLWGPSPGGAAAELKCSRAHIDMLVNAGVLDRSEYNGAGHKVIMISARSIDAAKKTKKETGAWLPRER